MDTGCTTVMLKLTTILIIQRWPSNGCYWWVFVCRNEKEGIPADIIQLLDVCVEIPQQGVIRSLNVHVSGALLVWEYTRQHLSADTSPLDSQQDVDQSVSQQ